MTNLTCNAVGCASNRDNRCCQPAIKVQGKSASQICDTRCQSFHQKGCDEVSNSTHFCQPNCSCEVKCTAGQCCYNHDGDCTAENVCIQGHHAQEMSQTQCGSFRREEPDSACGG